VETWAVDQADGNEAEPVHGGAGQQEDHRHGGEPPQHLDRGTFPSPSLGDPNTHTIWGPSGSKHGGDSHYIFSLGQTLYSLLSV
jgi:hypothetical protein